MPLKSILNHVKPLQSFVYKRERLVITAGGSTEIEVDIEPRANGRPICSKCGRKRPGYDRLPTRRSEFVPLWNSAIPAALHVLDRFHIMRNMNVAIDEVRRTEAAQMKQDGYEPILTKSRWCLLNLTDNQEIRASWSR